MVSAHADKATTFELRESVRDGGILTNGIIGIRLTDHQDDYAKDCKT